MSRVHLTRQRRTGIRRIYFEFAQGNKLLLDDDKLQVEMGSTKLTMKNNGDVELDSSRHNIRLTDGGSNLVDIQSQSGQVKVQAQMKVTVEAPQIELVEGATHPLVFGDSLLRYLNQLVSLYQTHLHPGAGAGRLPVTPAPPVPRFHQPRLICLIKVKNG
jgi:hypothetical protein